MPHTGGGLHGQLASYFTFAATEKHNPVSFGREKNTWETGEQFKVEGNYSKVTDSQSLSNYDFFLHRFHRTYLLSVLGIYDGDNTCELLKVSSKYDQRRHS